MPQEGQTATNPQTGERAVYRGNRWIVIPKSAIGAGLYNPNLPMAPDDVGRRQQFAADYKDIMTQRGAVSNANQAIQKASRFLDLNKEVGTGIGQMMIPNKLWDTRLQEMDGISSVLQGMARPEGSGATSDFEQRLYRQGVPERTKKGTTNQNIVNQMKAERQRELDRLAFREQYLTYNGTVAGADELWDRYEQSNPYTMNQGEALFLNKKRQPWRQFFGLEAAPQKPSSPPRRAAQVTRYKYDAQGNLIGGN